VRIGHNLAVLRQKRTLKDASCRDQQLVGWIAMKGLWQLCGFHDDLWIEVQEKHAWFSQGAFDPRSHWPIQLKLPILHELGHLPAGNDTDAKRRGQLPAPKVRGARAAVYRAVKSTRPKYGCPAESPQGFPLLTGDRLQGLMIFENRTSEGSARGRCEGCLSRNHQNLHKLAGLKR